MKAILKFLLILFLIIATIISVVIIKAEPTARDEELVELVQQSTETAPNKIIIDDPINNDIPDVNIANDNVLESTEIEQKEMVDNEDIYVEEVIDELIEEKPEEVEETTPPTTCPHTNTSTKITDATCKSEGKETIVCDSCGEKIQETIISKLSHTLETVTQNATCDKEGYIKTICSICQTVLESETIPQESHSLKIIDEKKETPFEDGYRIHQCKKCGSEFLLTIIFTPFGDVDLYAPSAGIHCEVTLGECNQANTDKFDVTCDMNFIDNNNPVFFGHNTRTLGKLHKLKIGDLIYLTTNGETSVYKVTVSEEGFLINGGINIQGKETGTLCIEACDKNTLHFFTCYPTIQNYNARWIVLAERADI